MELINIKNLTKHYGKEIKALNDVNFSIESGTIFGLLGPNGAGKTTMIKVLAGIISDFKGKVTIDGIKLPTKKTSKLIGYMPQSYALYMELSVKENLDFFASINGLKDSITRKEAINNIIELLQLTDKRNSIIHNLSGGMRQRVSLGCALIHKPKILLLDEPTIGLDPKLRLQFWEYFNNLKKDGSTILITTHVFDEAKFCSNLAFIRDGNIIAHNKTEQILKEANTNDIEKAYLYFISKINGTMEATK